MTKEALKLKEMPYLYLSGGSKELFHSNFLAWLSSAHKRDFLSLLQSLGIDTTVWETDYEVKREYRHFDLCIINQKKTILVLENKIKTLPESKQLHDYWESSAEAPHHILLSLVPYYCDGWINVTYKELASKLRDLDIDDMYVSDYISFIENLTSLTDKWLDQIQDDTIFCDLISDSNTMYTEAKELRLHDMYSKLVYSSIHKRLYSLISNVPDAKLVDVEYFRGSPILTVEISAKHNNGPLAYRIQIQGNMYKYMDICTSDSSDDVKTFEIVGANSFIGVPVRRPKSGENGCYKYRLYNKRQVHNYIYKDIPQSTTLLELLATIFSDVQLLISNL